MRSRTRPGKPHVRTDRPRPGRPPSAFPADDDDLDLTPRTVEVWVEGTATIEGWNDEKVLAKDKAAKYLREIGLTMHFRYPDGDPQQPFRHRWSSLRRVRLDEAFLEVQLNPGILFTDWVRRLYRQFDSQVWTPEEVRAAQSKGRVTLHRLRPRVVTRYDGQGQQVLFCVASSDLTQFDRAHHRS